MQAAMHHTFFFFIRSSQHWEFADFLLLCRQVEVKPSQTKLSWYLNCETTRKRTSVCARPISKISSRVSHISMQTAFVIKKIWNTTLCETWVVYVKRVQWCVQRQWRSTSCSDAMFGDFRKWGGWGVRGEGWAVRGVKTRYRHKVSFSEYSYRVFQLRVKCLMCCTVVEWLCCLLHTESFSW